MKIALVICPMWDIDFPSYNIALLSAILKNKGFKTECFDLIRSLYKMKKDFTDKWHLDNPYEFWRDSNAIEKIFLKWKNSIDDYILKFEEFEIIGFTVYSLNTFFTVQLAKLIKKRFPMKYIILGGPECFSNFNKEYFTKFKFIDAICYGEADYGLPIIINQISNNISF